MTKEQLSLIHPAEERPEVDIAQRIAQIAALPPRVPEEREPSEAALDQGHGRHLPSYNEIGQRRLPEVQETLAKATSSKPTHWPPKEAA